MIQLSNRIFRIYGPENSLIFKENEPISTELSAGTSSHKKVN